MTEQLDSQTWPHFLSFCWSATARVRSLSLFIPARQDSAGSDGNHINRCAQEQMRILASRWAVLRRCIFSWSSAEVIDADSRASYGFAGPRPRTLQLPRGIFRSRAS